MGSGESSLLRAELEEERRKYTDLQERYTEMVEQHAVGQDQISALLTDAAGEGSVFESQERLLELSGIMLNAECYRTRAFNHLRTQLAQTGDDLKRETLRAEEFKAVLNDRDRELHLARPGMTPEQIEATQELLNSSLRGELLASRDRIRTLSAEHEMQRSQLIDAFVAKDKLQKQVDELRGAKPTGAIDDSKITDETIAQDVDKVTEKVDKLRDRLRERQQVSSSPRRFDRFHVHGPLSLASVVPGEPKVPEAARVKPSTKGSPDVEQAPGKRHSRRSLLQRMLTKDTQ
jgi:protein HOOK3